MQTKLGKVKFFWLFALLWSLTFSPVIGSAQDTPVWSAWESKDIGVIGDDGSGSTFAFSDEVTTPDGNPTLMVTPSGTSEETKLALPLTGEALTDFLTYGQVELDIYLPESNALNPNTFFMGMADVTTEFMWMGGIFSQTQAQPGWNRVVYTLDPAMRPVVPDRQYTIFLSFFNASEDGTKTPLTEPFYLGSAYLSGESPIEPPAPAEEGQPAEPVSAESLLWAAWDAKDVATIGDDNTGSTVALSEEVTDSDGTPALMITPSGTSEETKIAVPFLGADLAAWANYTQLALEVYLPEGNTLNANTFFLGMADVTTEFAWVAGVFSETEVQPGWNTIVYPIDPLMRQTIADHNYMLYFSFFYQDENGNKTPLSEPFYVGSATLTGAAVVQPALEAAIWQVWEARNPGMFGDDNTGTEFAQSTDIPAPNGTPSLQIIPSGTAEETKLAYPVSGNNLQSWMEYGQIELEIYLPAENAINPNTFFLGAAEITSEWTWAGGLFGTVSGETGWQRVTFTLGNLIGPFNPNGAYMIYLASFHTDANGNKTPLTQPFYLGSIHLIPAAELEPTSVPQDTSADQTYMQEVAILLGMDDEAFLDAVARETFDFFWYEANPANGLIKDRSTEDSASSIASVGFGLAAIPIAVDRGWISYERGYERALTTLNTFLNGGVQGEHGFFYHFVNMETGERMWSSEVSSIDTALLVAGALVAGQYFAGTEVQEAANQLYANVEWDWMMAGGDMLKMGWKPDTGFLTSEWDHFDESLILYALAIGSPTHPIPAETWDRWDRPVNPSNGGYIYLIGEPLFVYQYPLAFLNLRGMEDAYANYWNNTVRACERNRQFAIDNSANYLTYRDGVWGISASDGPRGYRAYGAAGGNHDGTVAPYASAACLPFTPEFALESMRAMLSKYGPRVWREYGFVSAINEDADWYSTEHIGIDQGDIQLMIANYQDGFVWNLFMQNEHIQNALDAMGFVESSGDYAVTPAYLAQITGQ